MLRAAALREHLLALPYGERDAWIDGVLGIEAPPPDRDLPAGAVPYLPCGVDEIVALVRDAPVGPEDVFVDIGAGVGRAAIIAHLLSGARTCGIEIQPHLVTRARERCAALGLDRVAIVQGDAAATELDALVHAIVQGDAAATELDALVHREAASRVVFFLYAPCNGDLLARVLDQIAVIAGRRRIVVGTVDLPLEVAWLSPRASASASLALYDSQ